MRDVNRIDNILSELEQLWKKHPDVRFFQLMDWLETECFPFVPYYVEDDEALNIIKRVKEWQYD